MYYTYMDSPIGIVNLTANDQGVTRLHLNEEPTVPKEAGNTVLAQTMEQLKAYFAGELQEFTVPLDPDGTEFQRQVWSGLQDIPYGHTWSYGELAQHIGRPSAVRAVGLANGRNPVSLIVPCHRVIGADGSLTGYAGGIERKKFLLDHEKHILNPALF
ncbi:methylated-DNA--[protein]-cysteine S-methyltransferase [Haloglycomyces albus]|uniref:methylated-DNA--[protein]-cysteine S-methyltransferase n=1 Tax=Haloglycomyces albus TaxID=526067 RepID=UPI0004A21992|nr:methylated-DNA--[protein]-cysteine S-methyltransferase [Haloglycomyces albus]